jgi:hypothetical protein
MQIRSCNIENQENQLKTVLRIQIRDQGSAAFLTSGSGIRDEIKNQDPDPG